MEETINRRQKSVKINDKQPHAKRKGELYNFLGRHGIFPSKMHAGQGVFFAVILEGDLEKILKKEVVEKAQEKGFEIITPIEYGALKTVIVKEIDAMVDDYNEEEIKESIEMLNEGVKVEQVYKFQTASKMIKVTFTATHMANKAAKEGLVILNQRIPPRRLEKEIFVKLTPCSNCYGYDHDTKNCVYPKKTICAKCSGEGHRQGNCNSEELRCINCNGAHHTLAARCEVRKNLIKSKRKELRERSRSRSRARENMRFEEQLLPGISYSDRVTGRSSKGKKEEPKEVGKEIKELTTIILSAVIYSHYMETLMPGSFQDNMDKIYRKNGLRTVKFPEQEMNIQGLSEIYRGILGDQLEKEMAEGEEEITDLDVSEMEAEVFTKRQREDSVSPMGEADNKKKKEEAREKEEYQPLKIAPQMKPPIPPPPKQMSVKSKSGITEKQAARESKTEQEVEALIRKEKETQRVRTSSQSSVASTGSTGASKQRSDSTKDMKITIYVPDMDQYKAMFAKPLTNKDKNDLVKVLLQGGAKVTWDHPEVKREGIIRSLQTGKLTLDRVTFKIIGRKEYVQLKTQQ